MELPPQGVARGLTPGFLPLQLGWGPNPKVKREKRSMGGKQGERLVGGAAKRHSVPLRVGVGVDLRSRGPSGAGTVWGE